MEGALAFTGPSVTGEAVRLMGRGGTSFGLDGSLETLNSRPLVTGADVVFTTRPASLV